MLDMKGYGETHSAGIEGEREWEWEGKIEDTSIHAARPLISVV